MLAPHVSALAGTVLLVHATSEAQHSSIPVRRETERGGRGCKIVTLTRETERPPVP